MNSEFDKIKQVDLCQEMQTSYIDYAMAVIIGRALPDVRDGLKPVHRRVLYTMFEGGYKPDKAFNKCSRVVGEVMGKFHPHGDLAIYDALVRLVQKWNMRYPLIEGQGNFGSPGNDAAAASRYTECRMNSIAMEMVRNIDLDTVDFQKNYDGKEEECVVLPSRFPNLLANGSSGIAVGMATNIPPHNLRELAEGVYWCLDNPNASKEETLEALIERIKGPDFPKGASIIGRNGIEEMYRTGRGSIVMRAIVNTEEIQGRTCLVVTELPYQVNPDNLAQKIADLVKNKKIKGISDIRDESSGRTGQRLVFVLKRDAIAKIVLNNLYKYTQLQENFSANMIAIVNKVPCMLQIDDFIRYWIDHQIEVIVRRTKYLLKKAEERIHILDGYLKALGALDKVISLIRGSSSADKAKSNLINILEVDDVQVRAILSMQLRQLAALESNKIIKDYKNLKNEINDLKLIIVNKSIQADIVKNELREIVHKYGDDRRTVILENSEPNVNIEELIPEKEVVITITRSGYVKRTNFDQYRSQHRGGKGARGTSLRDNDVVEHFFVTTTHHWLLFFTNLGRVYRKKAYELPEGSRDARGQHVANLLEFQSNEKIAQVMDLKNYTEVQYLILATKSGLVKKTRLEEYNSSRSGGVIAINLHEDDELISANLTSINNDIVLVSRKGQSIRFKADDQNIRPTRRATSGVTGMRFRKEDELLTAAVVTDDSFVFVVTEAGFAKRTPSKKYRVQNRGGLGVKVAKLEKKRGDLIGALIVKEDDEVLVIMESGKVVRSPVAGVPAKGRDTMGVIFSKIDDGDKIIAIAKNVEKSLEK